MKKFILISLFLLLTALLIVVSLFAYIQYQLRIASETTSTQTREGVLEVDSAAVPESNSDEGIPLKSLPLSEGQEKVLNTVGIDADTFVITPEMTDCALEVLGENRFTEIKDGATPTFLETSSLLKCL